MNRRIRTPKMYIRKQEKRPPLGEPLFFYFQGLFFALQLLPTLCHR